MARRDRSRRWETSNRPTACPPASADESSSNGRAAYTGTWFRWIEAFARSISRFRRAGPFLAIAWCLAAAWRPATVWRLNASRRRVAHGWVSSARSMVHDERRNADHGSRIAIRVCPRAKPTTNGASVPTMSVRIADSRRDSSAARRNGRPTTFVRRRTVRATRYCRIDGFDPPILTYYPTWTRMTCHVTRTAPRNHVTPNVDPRRTTPGARVVSPSRHRLPWKRQRPPLSVAYPCVRRSSWLLSRADSSWPSTFFVGQLFHHVK